jgi:hypothetical protein
MLCRVASALVHLLIADNNPAVIENLLEFHCRFGALVFGQISLAAHLNRIKGRKEPDHSARRHAQLIGNGNL